ncbi:hypothetical protein CU102_20855 [Phyllobacterium brassicacearum]|uniref:Uncharacterized protein n=1 Tax=Phyllobacterium brassicacearum TaxID=314235 RepID=A0A2P7BEN4_9HYPH|nr:hypothetical protein [Phyllobacterium brassicacearum]PSH64892.1 hypothetical protein CU102_20855 [Phyllobacterium brassicacearum]TDQ22956.1 hypothetical protein DEV91_11758 [Phyllobacterium brassicacearum]
MVKQDLDEPATLYFPPKSGEGVAADRETKPFDALHKALLFAVDGIEDPRKDLTYIVTGSGSRFGWDEIKVLYEHVLIAQTQSK